MIEEAAIRRIAKKIFDTEQRRKAIAHKIDKKGFHKVLRKPIEGRIAGVDGGVVSKNLHGMDLMIVRAVSAVFDFKDDKLSGVQYHPNAFPEPRVHYYAKNLENPDFGVWKSLKRLTEELSTAISTLETFSPDFILMDGSIAPQQGDKPNKESMIYQEYLDVISLFERLHNHTNVIGVVEDSQGAGFIRKLIPSEVISPDDKHILEQSVDTNFLDHVLDIGERTFVFNYSDNPSEHPVLRDLKSGNKIRCFYVKITKFDRPLRVEFISKGNDEEYADIIASKIFALSFHHQEYAFPSVLTEADLQAHLTVKEMEDLYYSLCSQIGEVSSLQPRRRDIRPF
jgi:hypothetical protein